MDSSTQFISDELIEKMLTGKNEKALFQAKFLKVGKVGKKERVIVVSTEALYLIDREKVIEKQMISMLNHIIKSVNTPEILLYFTNEKDMVLKFSEDELATFTDIVKLQFAA